MKRILLPVLFAINALACSGAHLNWTNTAGGLWSNPVNWSPNQLPAGGDSVTITNPGNYWVALNGGSVVASRIRLGGVTGSQTLDWSGGSISAALTVEANGVLRVTTVGNQFMSGVLTNRGQVIVLGVLRFNSLVLENQSDGVVDFQTDGSFAYAGGNHLVRNGGTLGKSGGVSQSVLDVRCENTSGTVVVLSGTLACTRGGSIGGWYQVDPGAELQFNGGTFSFAAAHQLIGGGSLSVSSGTVGLTGQMNGPLDWRGGVINAALTVGANGLFRVMTDGSHYMSGGLTNRGRLLVTGTMRFNNLTVENQSGGWLDFQGSGGFAYAGGNHLVRNAGTLRKSGGTDNSVVDVRVENSSGTMAVQIGALVCTRGGVIGGNYQVATGAALQFNGGNFSLVGTHTVSGGGFLGTAAGSIGLAGLMNGPLDWSGGSINAAFTVGTNGLVRVTPDGNQNMSGGLTNQGLMLVTGTMRFNSLVFENQARGVVDFQNNGGFAYAGGSPVLRNAGIVRKTNDTGISVVDVRCENTGTMELQRGALNFTRSTSFFAADSSVISVTLGGTDARTGFGQINLSGAQVVRGRVIVRSTPGYRPLPGDRFNVLTYHYAGGGLKGFGGLDLGGGLRLEPSLTQNGLSFVAAQIYDENLPTLSVYQVYRDVWLVWPEAYAHYEVQWAPEIPTSQWTTLPRPPGSSLLLTNVGARRFFRLRE